MALELDIILSHIEAFVAVVDRNHEIVYRNRACKEEVLLQTPDMVHAIDECLTLRRGFKTVVADAEAAGSRNSDNSEVAVISGQYADGGFVVVSVTKSAPAADGADKLSMIANMSHEIRTPVNAITGFSRLLAESDDPVKKKRYVEQIENNNRLLLNLVDDVLDAAKMNEGELKISEREIELNELIRSVDASIRFRVNPETMLNYVLGAPECRINTDPERLSQILFNLLTNACKFTPRGNITFGYEVKENEIYFFVKDTGVGISPEKQPLLFKRFSKQNDEIPGTGLGLSICKEIIGRLGGEIGVESAGVGKGSLFWFTLPVKPEEVINDEIAEVTEEPVKPSVRHHRHTLLVAEDNESNYLLISSMLEDSYDLIHAWNGREAVEMYQEHKPDLILMDINMPYMDGYEATRRIRQISDSVPVIAVTAYAFSSDRARIMENGFNSYVSKPVNMERLTGEINRLLG